MKHFIYQYIWKPFTLLIERAQLSRSNDQYHWMLSKCFDFLESNKISGDYLEFGCYRARTFKSAWSHIKRRKCFERRLYGFDSFAGLPECAGVDSNSVFFKGKYQMSEKDFRSAVEVGGCPSSQFTLVPGYYSESLNQELYRKLGLKSAALIYIDCDLYSSTKEALEWCLPLMQTGTIICFDDFFAFAGDAKMGEQLAMSEFLVMHGHITFVDWHLYGWHGKAFIVNVHSAENIQEAQAK